MNTHYLVHLDTVVLNSFPAFLSICHPWLYTFSHLLSQKSQ